MTEWYVPVWEIDRHVPVDSLHKLSSIALGSAVIFGMEAEDM